MPIQTAPYTAFARRSPERSTVRLARIATGNTILGGCSALVLAKHADRLGVKFMDGVSAREIVADVYSRSTGRESEQFGGWECPECGCAHVGRDNAFKCCSESQEDEQ